MQSKRAVVTSGRETLMPCIGTVDLLLQKHGASATDDGRFELEMAERRLQSICSFTPHEAIPNVMLEPRV